MQLGFKKELDSIQLTKEKYFNMYRKIWAIMRYEIYTDLTNNHGGMDNAGEQEIFAIYDNKMKNFEEYRVEVYRLIMKDSEATSRTARRNMLKSYITYAMAAD